MFVSLDAKSLRFLSLSLAVVVAAASQVAAAGFVHSPNFIILTPPKPSEEAAAAFAKRLLAKAEQYRKEIALEWLGEELPPSIGQVMINVRFTADGDSGLTWAKDHAERNFHAMYLATAPEHLPEGLLAHEMAHCILATKFPYPRRLPAWLDEGIASRYDDAERVAIRQRITAWYVTSGQWPRLAGVLAAEKVHSDDQAAYTLAATLTQYLLSRGDKRLLLRFGQLTQDVGLDRALVECYGIKNASELESQWRAWIARPAR